MHETVIHYIIGVQASIILALLALFLALLYALDVILMNSGRKIALRKEGIIVRAVNWLVFGFVFLLFGRIIELMEIETWRASARLALLFLVLSEIAFEVTTMWPEIKRMLWKKEISP